MTDQGASVSTVDLTPGEDQRRSDEIADAMWLRFAGLAGFRETAKAAYRAGREDAARDIRALTVGHDEGNILHDAMNLAADVAEGKCAGGIIRLVPKGERA